MHLTVTSKKEGPLLKRTHVTGKLDFPGEKTPSNADTKQALAKATGAAEDTIAIRRIAMAFGSTSATVDAYVYQSKELLDKTEPRHKPKAAQPGQPAAAKA